ncbi:50S ribosomal protein L18 [uncultured Jatrophihabitans sp.]|uniref:50S ribosomal protein L18 n=1 Tax=uncultured Jatrophihabitans sp. TaxID=1610747 RepID=UPI0035CC831E
MSASTIAKQARRSAGISASRRVSKSRRHFRLRKKVAGSADRPRLVVTRSARHLYVQLVDDGKGVTLASASTYKVTDGDKTAQAKALGATLADAAKAAGVTRVVFDRGGNTYTGRIAAFADAAREAGLEF